MEVGLIVSGELASIARPGFFVKLPPHRAIAGSQLHLSSHGAPRAPTALNALEFTCPHAILALGLWSCFPPSGRGRQTILHVDLTHDPYRTRPIIAVHLAHVKDCSSRMPCPVMPIATRY